jgi:hypothetical protein
MPSSNLSFRAPEPFLEQIRSRDIKGVDNPGAVAKRDLIRWYGVLQQGLGEVDLTPAEAVVLIHFVGAFHDRSVNLSEMLMAHHVINGASLHLEEVYTPVRASLADKMANWSTVARYAAWDAAERYQVVSRHGPLNTTFGMALHRVGLHSYVLPPEDLATVERMGAVSADLLPGEYIAALKEGTK